MILGRLRSHSSTGAAEEGGHHSLPVRATDRTGPLSTLAPLLAVFVFCHLDQYHLIPLLRCLLSGGGSAPSQAAPVTNASNSIRGALFELKGHVNLEIFGLVHLNHAAGFLNSNSGVKMS